MKCNPKRRRYGFTLLEMLVALSVLSILVVFIAKMIGAMQATSQVGTQGTLTDSDARVAFEMIGQDLAAMLKRNDIDFWACNPVAGSSGLAEVNSGNDTLLLFSDVASDDSDIPSGGNRKISLICYQIAASANNPGLNGASLPCLLRSGKAVGISDSGFMGLKTNGLPIRFSDTGTQSFPSKLLPSNTSTSSDFDVLASGVVQMVIGFQLYPDNAPITLDDGSAQGLTLPNSQGQIVYFPPVRKLTPLGGGASVNYLDFTRISAIVVGLVVIDHTTLKLLSPTQVSAISSAFSVPQMNMLPVPSWQATFNGIIASLKSTIPLPALKSVHIYERMYPITSRGDAAP
jgi:prepilin-type N-terminal cleavage/methylation domain-containing protein